MKAREATLLVGVLAVVFLAGVYAGAPGERRAPSLVYIVLSP